MTPNYQGKSVNYDRKTNTYSRSPVKIVRVCRYGFKRDLVKHDECPCFQCTSNRSGNTLIKVGLLDRNGRNQNNEV